MTSETRMVRTIKLDTTSLQPVVELLQGLEGVDVVEQTAPQKLRITYNFSRIGWGTLCEQMKSIGAYKQSGMLNRWRDGWRDFKEQNMRDNLRHQPACCSKPPVGAGRK
jgi:hypothetical protein